MVETDARDEPELDNMFFWEKHTEAIKYFNTLFDLNIENQHNGGASYYFACYELIENHPKYTSFVDFSKKGNEIRYNNSAFYVSVDKDMNGDE